MNSTPDGEGYEPAVDQIGSRRRKSLYDVPGFLLDHGISRTRLYEEIKAGRLIARKIGGRTVIDGDDAAAWRASLPIHQPRIGAGRA